MKKQSLMLRFKFFFRSLCILLLCICFFCPSSIAATVDFNFSVDLSAYWSSIRSGEISVSFSADNVELYEGATVSVYLDSNDTTYDYSCYYTINSDLLTADSSDYDLAWLSAVMVYHDENWMIGAIESYWRQVDPEDSTRGGYLYVRLLDSYTKDGYFDLGSNTVLYSRANYIDATFDQITLVSSSPIDYVPNDQPSVPLPSSCLFLLFGVFAVFRVKRRIQGA
nr:hypothetical protein [uncultured Desulfobacter sp.]